MPILTFLSIKTIDYAWSFCTLLLKQLDKTHIIIICLFQEWCCRGLDEEYYYWMLRQTFYYLCLWSTASGHLSVNFFRKFKSSKTFYRQYENDMKNFKQHMVTSKHKEQR